MKVKFVPQNIELEVKPHQSVMDLAHKNGIKIKSVCNGMPSCAECRVRLIEGEANVLPPSVKELSLIGTGHFIDQRRLSCQLICFGDIVVDLTEQVEKASNDTKRKPQGNMRADQTAESKAITGNLIEQDDDIKQFIGQFKDDAKDEQKNDLKNDTKEFVANERQNPERNDNRNNQSRSRGREDNNRNQNRGHHNRDHQQRDNQRRDHSNKEAHSRGTSNRDQNRDAQKNQNAGSNPNRSNQNQNQNQGQNPNQRRPFKFRPQG